MTLRADLHVHSTASDGRLAPAEVVRRAAEAGLSVLALTDHDSTEGIEEALQEAERHPGLLVLPGVEINTDIPGAEIHMLGYCMDCGDKVLAGELRKLRQERIDRGRKMVERLGALGIKIDWARVQEIAGDASIGRPHVAQAILEGGYVQDLAEAFDRYIGRNGPAYVERGKLTPEKAIDLIIEAGGFAVMAHPHSFGPERTREIVSQLIPAGLSGLEVYYNMNLPAGVGWLVALAKEKKLLMTGGTDFHGIGSDPICLGQTEVPEGVVEAFLAVARRHAPRLVDHWSPSRAA